MSYNKRRPTFELVLATDVETSGIALGKPNPTFNEETGEKYQILSIGLVVADVDTLRPIDKLYLEINFDESKYTWSDEAEKVHGLSRDHLATFGLNVNDACTKIVSFIEKYYGPIEQIRKLPLLGHNVGTFDLLFLQNMLRDNDFNIQFGNRHIDTFTLGVVLLDLFSSNELFDFFKLERDPEAHNALDDALFALKSARNIRKFFKKAGT